MRWILFYLQHSHIWVTGAAPVFVSMYYSYSNDARDVPLVILWQNLSIGRSPVALWMLSTSRMYGALAIFVFDFFDLWWKIKDFSEFSRWLDYVRSLHLKIIFAISIEDHLRQFLKCDYAPDTLAIWNKSERFEKIFEADSFDPLVWFCVLQWWTLFVGKKHHNLITRDNFLQTEFQTTYSPNPLYSWHCKSKLLQIYCLWTFERWGSTFENETHLGPTDTHKLADSLIFVLATVLE